MARKKFHWLAILTVGLLLLLDHLPEDAPDLLLSSLTDQPGQGSGTDFEDLPIMYD